MPLKPQIIKKKEIRRSAFLDAKTNNKARDLIRDFKNGHKLLNDPSIKPDIIQLIHLKRYIDNLSKKTPDNRTQRDRELIKNTEYRIRAILKDVAAKRAKILREDTLLAKP